MTQVTPQTIGSRLEAAIKAKGLRRETAASAIGVSVDTLVRYFKGESDISAINVWKIGMMTERPFSWFAGDDAAPIPEEIDRATLTYLLERLDEHHRGYETAIVELRRMLSQ